MTGFEGHTNLRSFERITKERFFTSETKLAEEILPIACNYNTLDMDDTFKKRCR